MPETRHKIVSARELRARAYWEVEIEPGFWVEMRRVDMITLYMAGAVPTPLMAALNRMQQLQQEAKKEGDEEGRSLMERMSDDDRQNMIALLRRYACLAIKNPVIVEEDDGDPDHVPVEILSSDALLKIWGAKAPDADAPRLTEADAGTFPGQPVDAAPVPDGEGVRPEAVIVAAPGGGTAEFIGS